MQSRSEFMYTPYLSLDLIKISKTILSNFSINHEMQMIMRTDEKYILYAFKIKYTSHWNMFKAMFNAYLTYM